MGDQNSGAGDHDMLLDNLDFVPEALRDSLAPLFQETEDGKYRFTKPEDAAPLKRKLFETVGQRKREQEKRTAAETELASLREKLRVDDEDLDLDSLADIIRSHRSATSGNGNGTGNGAGKGTADMVARAEAAQERKKAVDDAVKKKDTELQALRDENATLTKQLHLNVIEGGVLSYCADTKLPFRLTDKAAKILLKDVRAETPFIVKDGKWAMRDGVINDDGEPFETPQEYLAYQAQALGLIVPSSGGGAQSQGAAGNNGAPSARTKKLEDMSEDEKAKLSKDDPEAFRSAVRAKAGRDAARLTQNPQAQFAR